jgi:hypothetical protein
MGRVILLVPHYAYDDVSNGTTLPRVYCSKKRLLKSLFVLQYPGQGIVVPYVPGDKNHLMFYDVTAKSFV